jgi:hypothetical protein
MPGEPAKCRCNPGRSGKTCDEPGCQKGKFYNIHLDMCEWCSRCPTGEHVLSSTECDGSTTLDNVCAKNKVCKPGYFVNSLNDCQPCDKCPKGTIAKKGTECTGKTTDHPTCIKPECNADTCENGVCIDHNTCLCNPGFRGKNCDEPDLCYYEDGGGKLRKKRCDHGTCNPYSGRCVCEPGYSGYFCERDACEEVGGNSYCYNKGTCVVDEETHKPTCQCHIGNNFGERCNEHCPLDHYWSDEHARCMLCKVKHNDPDRYQYCDGSWDHDVSQAYLHVLYCDDKDCTPYFDNVSCTWDDPLDCPDGYKPSGRDSHGLHWESSRGYNPGNPCYFGSDLRRCEFDHRPTQK